MFMLRCMYSCETIQSIHSQTVSSNYLFHLYSLCLCNLERINSRKHFLLNFQSFQWVSIRMHWIVDTTDTIAFLCIHTLDSEMLNKFNVNFPSFMYYVWVFYVEWQSMIVKRNSTQFRIFQVKRYAMHVKLYTSILLFDLLLETRHSEFSCETAFTTVRRSTEFLFIDIFSPIVQFKWIDLKSSFVTDASASEMWLSLNAATRFNAFIHFVLDFVKWF